MSESDGGATGLVQLRAITKRFGSLVANDAVDLSLRAGEVHGILGENGAGKTTLMRILYGLTSPDQGQVMANGRPLSIRSPRDAIAAGIGMVTQHFSLVTAMTVAENLTLGRPQGLLIDLEAARRRVEEAADRFGIRVRAEARVADLSVGEQQRVEILKALAGDCRVLILDEPTAVLVPQEVNTLFATLRRLTAAGLAVAFISHKLSEVLAVTQRVTVLRRGKVAGTVATSATDERQLATMMVGRPAIRAERPVGSLGDTALRVAGLDALGAKGLRALRGVSFTVAAGEIIGIAGVSGNGQTELAEVLSGMRLPTAGSIEIDGRNIAGSNPRRMMAAGLGRIAEDRHAAVVPDLSVAYNLVLEHLDQFRRGALLDEPRIHANAEELISRFGIVAAPDDPVRTLSGGNVQKVILARVLSRDPKVLVVSQPTRGLDVGATDYVRGELLGQAARGAGIVLISEDLDELLALSDRLLVFYEGRVVGELAAAGADPEQLGLLMARGSAA
ncbi:MAG: ABC transporter ATP-binding protein [Acidimicrobiia bacterium]